MIQSSCCRGLAYYSLFSLLDRRIYPWAAISNGAGGGPSLWLVNGRNCYHLWKPWLIGSRTHTYMHAFIEQKMANRTFLMPRWKGTEGIVVLCSRHQYYYGKSRGIPPIGSTCQLWCYIQDFPDCAWSRTLIHFFCTICICFACTKYDFVGLLFLLIGVYHALCHQIIHHSQKEKCQ